MIATDTSFTISVSADKSITFGVKINEAHIVTTMPLILILLASHNTFAAADNSNVTSNRTTRPPNTVAALIIKV